MRFLAKMLRRGFYTTDQLLAQMEKSSRKYTKPYKPPKPPKLAKLKSQIQHIPPYAEPPPPDNVFVPRTFDEYIGQSKAKEVCKIIVDSAILENRQLPNILIFGPYGLGKTTLSRLIMERYEQPYRFMDATLAAKTGFFKESMVIDEIHNLPPEVCDELNTLLDQQKLHLIGCTTNPGALPAPFRSRLRSIHLEDYTVEDIRQIISNTLKRRETKATEDAVLELAKRSRFNPRQALQNLAFSLEIMAISRANGLTLEAVKEALDKLDIDERGLTSIDRKYLSILSSVKPTGLTQLCAMLGTKNETIEHEIEPFLLQSGLIERTSKGRLLVETTSLEELLERSIIDVEVMKLL